MRFEMLPAPCGHCGSIERLVPNGLANVCVRCAMRILDAHLAYCQNGCSEEDRCGWASEFRRNIVDAREGSQ